MATPTKGNPQSPATDEKPQPKKHGFFYREKKQEKSEKEKSATEDVAVVVDPSKLFVRPVGFFELFKYATPLELTLNGLTLICAAASGASQPLLSLLFGNLTNAFVNFGIALNSGLDVEQSAAAFRRVAAQDALYLVCVGVGMYVVTHAYMYVWTYTGEINSKRIREMYLKAVLRQDVAFFDTLGAGEVATRIQTDTHLIQLGISEKVAIAVSFIAAFFTGFLLAYIRSWRIALVISSILPCIALAGGAIAIFGRKYKEMSLQAIAEAGSLAEEVISTVRTAQAFGTQSTLSTLYNTHVLVAHKAEVKIAIAAGFGMGIFFFVIYSAYALAFSFGTTLILSGHADAGTVINVFFAVLIGAISLALLAPQLQAIASAQAAAGKVFATIERVPPIDSASEAGQKLKDLRGVISFENVVFHYPSRPDIPIIKGLTVEFQAGKTTALVGSSGSGKSTIVSLIERFYDPVSGVVRLDGVDIKDINVQWLRQQIGLVQQEPSLFATTIKGNVAHGLIGSRFENATEEEKLRLIKEACVKANADSFIEKLPLGYDTMVGERGFLLSGGQKQRIAIARAIVSDPVILLLDEATSALDTQSEGIVQDALDKAAAGRTTITIAHRLSTIRDANQIYVMGGGEILEHGTHNDLLSNDNGLYAQLVSAQKLKGRTFDAHKDDGDIMIKADVQEAIKDEQPLVKRRASLDGEVSKEKKTGHGHYSDKEYSMPYLFKRMGHINRNEYRLYILGTIAAIGSGLIYPCFGIVFGESIMTFSGVDRSRLRHEGDRNALWMFVIAIIGMIVVAGQNYYYSRAAAGLTSKLRSLCFRAILRQDIAWFDEDRNSTGGLVSVLADNPTKISGLAGITLGAIVQSTATIIGGCIIGLVYGPKLAAVGIACIPFVVGAGYIHLRVVVLKDQTNKVEHEESAQLACEAAGAVRTVQSLTREGDCLGEYSRSLDAPLQRSKRTALFSTGLFALSQSMSFFAIALVFWYGSRLVSSLEYTILQFFVCLMSVTFGSIQAGGVFGFVPDISAAKGAASDIISLLDLVPKIDAESPNGTKVDSKSTQGHIRFNDVHFMYPTRPDSRVLCGMNFIVEPGTYVGLVGASGCGKSTIIQLLERFYDPSVGQISLDGVDISTLNVQDFRKQIALVSQEPTLYAGTIRFNILLGATKPEAEVTQEELEKACRDANILEFVQSLPQGFDTEVGGKGSQLSGGQKQRLAIARALIRNPKVLLLDEATSALDSQSESVVQTALNTAAKGRTTIAIAHRLSTIQNADRIYYIKEGRVAESGTHDELLRLKGGYFELVQLQALSKV